MSVSKADESQSKQTARLRRYFLAMPVYAVAAFLLYLSHQVGLIGFAPTLYGIGAMFCVNALLYLVFRLGLNLRFRDPSLTWLQISCANAILLFVFYSFDRERSLVLMMCLVVFLFGTFRFNVRQFLSVTVQFLSGFALVIYLLAQYRPASVEFHLLALQWVALALVLPCFAFIGGKLSELRQRLRHSNEELSTALATIQQSARLLRESEERFLRLTKLSSDWFWEQDENYRFTHIGTGNDGWSKVANRDFMGKTRWEMPAINMSEEEWAAHRAVLDARMPYQNFVYKVLNDAGQLRHLAVSGEPIFDAQGKFTGYRGVGRDITASVEADSALRASETRFRNTFDFAAIGMALVSLEGKWLQVNKALRDLLGFTEAEFRRLSFQDITHPDDLAADLDYVTKILRGDISNYQLEKRYAHKDGHEVWALLSVSLVRDADGTPMQFISQIQDITARKQAEKALNESEARFRATFDHASVGIMHSSLDRRILVVNRKFCEMVGYSAEELQQGSVRQLHHPEDSDADQHLEKQLVAGEIDHFSFEKRYIRKDGSVFSANRAVSLVRDENGRPSYFIRVIEDISARKEAEEKLLRLAHFDTLTDLPNRATFHDRLNQALVQARRRDENVGIMYLDLDHFKRVNDTLGHAVGDLLLKQVAQRLGEAVRAGDTVGRLSGDEFGIILAGLRDSDDASVVARKIVETFAIPFKLENNERFITASIGISIYPADGDEKEELMKAADAAMYRAKEKGRNNFHFYGDTA